MKKKDVIKELKSIAKNLNKTPGRRDIPHRLYLNCVRYFGSLNKAKVKANLRIYKRVCDPLPKKAYKLDKDLAKIASYLTFDGHLSKDLSGFLLSSKNKRGLENFKRLVKRKFKIMGVYKNVIGTFGPSISYRMFNTNASKLLNSLGVPKGDKMLVKFDVPDWIKKDRGLAREYLKICFYCEGTIYNQSKFTNTIRLNLNKSEEILDDGLKFMRSMKEMLKGFGIETTKIWISKGNKRKKDGKITKMMVFKIKANSINSFINRIGWLK